MNVRNGEVHFNFEQQFNDDNEYRYFSGIDEFHCVACGELTTVDDSYSSKGIRLVCGRCAEKLAEEMSIDLVDFLKNYIWRKSKNET